METFEGTGVVGSGDLPALTQRIREKGWALGFDAVGIAPAVALEPEGDRLLRWIAQGHHGEMDWMPATRDKRSDPGRVLPGAASVIAVAMNYFTENCGDDTPPPSDEGRRPETGRISCYAWGDDYHQVVGDRLGELFSFIRALLPDARGKVYVDTGPVMEKAWAARGGIGWIGKHTNLITRALGSYVFLGVILLDRELLYDTPVGDYCGTCTRCMDACPTQAIVAPYVLDARRCISYLTIEKRGKIPAEFQAAVGKWVFGCDICQEVCPWNRFAAPTEEESFRPRPENRAPLLGELLNLDADGFSRRTRRSPLKRARREGLTRNAALALANKQRTG